MEIIEILEIVGKKGNELDPIVGNIPSNHIGLSVDPSNGKLYKVTQQQLQVFAGVDLVNADIQSAVNQYMQDNPGQVMQNIAGLATTSTNPGTPVSNVAYDTSGTGIYINFKTLKTGTITTTTSSTAIVGVGTKFLTQLAAGMLIYNSAGVLIGTVSGTPTDDTHATLSANAAVAVTGGSFNGPVLINSGDGYVILRYNTTTQLWAKLSNPFPTFQKTITSITSPVPDQVGQIGVDANGVPYRAIALTGSELWKKLVRHSDVTMMYEPYFGTTLAIAKLSGNSFKLLNATSTYLIGVSSIQLENASGSDYTFTFSANSKILCLDTTKTWVTAGVYRKYSVGGVNDCLVEKDASTIIDPNLIPLCGYYNGIVIGFPIGEYLRSLDNFKTNADNRAYGDMVFEPMGANLLNIDFPASNQIRFKEKTYLIGKPNGHVLGLHSDTFPITITFSTVFGQVLVLDTSVNGITDGISAGFDKHYIDIAKTGTITAATNSTALVGVGTSFLTDLPPGTNVFSGGVYLGVTSGFATDNTHATLVGNSLAAVSGAPYSTLSGSLSLITYTSYDPSKHVILAVHYPVNANGDGGVIAGAGPIGRFISGYQSNATSLIRAYGDMSFEPMGSNTLNIDFPATNQIRFKEKTYLASKPNGHLLGLYSDSFPVTITFTAGQILVLDTTVAGTVDGIQTGYDKHYIDGATPCISLVSYTQVNPAKHIVMAVYYPPNPNGEGGIIAGAGLIGRYFAWSDLNAKVASLLIKNDYDRLHFSPYGGGLQNASFTGPRTLTLTGPIYLHGKVNSKIIQLLSSSYPLSYTWLNDGVTSQNLVFDKRKKFIANSVSNTVNLEYDQYSLDTSRTGTITTATNSKTVTGVGTLALSQLYVGEKIYSNTGALIGTIASIESDTSWTLAANAAVAVAGVSFTGQGAIYLETQEVTNTDYHVILLHAHRGTISPTGLMAPFWVNTKVDAGGPYRLNADKVIGTALQYTADATAKTNCAFILSNDNHVNVSDTLRTANVTEAINFGVEAFAKIKATSGSIGTTIEDVLDFIMFNGDMTDGLETTVSNYQLQVNAFNAEVAKSTVPVVKTIGNHDDNSYQGLFAQVYTKNQQRVNFINTIATQFPSLNIQIAPYTDACAYYFDNTAKKLRFICLDALDIPYVANGSNLKYKGLLQLAFRNSQLNWLAGTALDLSGKSVPSDWHVVLFSHVPLRNTGLGEFMHPTYIVPRIINAFKNGLVLNETWTDTVNGGDFSYSVSKDFTAQGQMNYVGCFSGHKHKDAKVTDTDFPDQTNVIVNNAWCLRDYEPQNNVNLDSGVNRTPGTVTQNSFEYVVIDKPARKVRLLRFGAGFTCADEPAFLSQRNFTY